jgi:hypothetical protein
MGLKPGGKWTRGVERKTAFAGAFSAFCGASEALLELADLEVSSSETDRIAQEHGEILDGLQREAEEIWRAPADPYGETPEAESSCERLVIEADGASVLTVKGEEHKTVYCGTAFGLQSRGESGGRPFLTDRLYTASGEDFDDFSQRLKALAWRGGMRHAQTAFIGDGALCLWKWAGENLPEDTVLIQDFWHVCEHLSQLAQTLFPDCWEEHFKRWKDQLRKSETEELLDTLRQLRRERRGKARQALDEQLRHLENARHRMDYARYKKEGWPIGSGAIEGTCKHLVKTRFNVTGARWRRKNIPKILALRLAVFNQEWENYWENQKAA